MDTKPGVRGELAVSNPYDSQINVKIPGMLYFRGFYLPVNKWLLYHCKDLANVVVSQMCSCVHRIMTHLLLIYDNQVTFLAVHWALLSWCITYLHKNSFAYLIYQSLSWLRQLGWDHIASNPAACEGNQTVAYCMWIYCSRVLAAKSAVLVHTDFLVTLLAVLAE